MTVEWIPFRDYSGAHHVLGAGACFIHPKNGNQYFWDCVQWSGAHQDLNIYRIVAKTGLQEHVVTFEGLKDSALGVERGQCFIGQGGALIVGTTLIPKGVPYVTETGFESVRCRIPNIDEAWSWPDVTALQQQIAALQATVASQVLAITAIETALGTMSGGLSGDDRAVLEWAGLLMRGELRSA